MLSKCLKSSDNLKENEIDILHSNLSSGNLVLSFYFITQIRLSSLLIKKLARNNCKFNARTCKKLIMKFKWAGQLPRYRHWFDDRRSSAAAEIARLSTCCSKYKFTTRKLSCDVWGTIRNWFDVWNSLMYQNRNKCRLQLNRRLLLLS